jgi:hypothetical protein
MALALLPSFSSIRDDGIVAVVTATYADETANNSV